MKILLIQFPRPFLNWERHIEDNPLSLAYIKAYFDKQDLPYSLELLPENLRLYGSDKEILDYIIGNNYNCIGFSCYCWNVYRTIDFAKRVKSLLPKITLIAGGPEITIDNVSEDFSIFDTLIFGEGEKGFYETIKNNLSGHIFPEQIFNLDEIPNPYLEKILSPHKDDILFFETQRGCPFGCVFCYYGKGFKKLRTYSLSRIKQILDFAKKEGVKNIYVLDPSFNFNPYLDEFLELLMSYDRYFSIHTELKPEYVDYSLAKKLSKSGIKSVEIGLQTIGKKSREKYLNMPFKKEKFLNGIYALKNAGIKMLVDMIIGLPGDNEVDIKNTAYFIKEYLSDETIQVFNLSVLPGTKLREKSKDWNVRWDKFPPYYVLQTEYLSFQNMQELFLWCEEFFDITFDAEEIPFFFDRSFIFEERKEHTFSFINRIIVRNLNTKMVMKKLDSLSLANHLTIEVYVRESFDELKKFVINLCRKFTHTPIKLILNLSDFSENILQSILDIQSDIYFNSTPRSYLNSYYQYTYDAPMNFLLYLLVPNTYNYRNLYEKIRNEIPVIIKLKNYSEINKWKDFPILFEGNVNLDFITLENVFFRDPFVQKNFYRLRGINKEIFNENVFYI